MELGSVTDAVLREVRGQRLRKARLAAGLSQKQVARRAGYTRSAVSNAEAGGYARRRFWELCDQRRLDKDRRPGPVLRDSPAATTTAQTAAIITRALAVVTTPRA